MLMLSPVMSSIAMFFQFVEELVSPLQVMRQVEPALKVSPGAGPVGSTSARTSKGAAKAKSATKVFTASIFSKGTKVKRKRSAFFLLRCGNMKVTTD